MKVVNIVFYGTIFWLAFTFLFYGGLYVNYIESNALSIFFNRFFMTAQIWWLWPIGLVVCGYLFVTESEKKFKLFLFFLLTLLSFMTWIPSVGESVGEMLYMQKGLSYRIGNKTVESVTLVYSAGGCDYVKLSNGKVPPCFPTSARAIEVE